MNKKRFIKIISVFLLVLFICFSSFEIKKTYTKAILPAVVLAYGTELLFSVAATAFIGNAVYQMGTEARKIYDDWHNKKNNDEKKAQYGYWGEKLKNSMTSEEVENALNSAVNVIDGAVGLTLSSKSYQEFIENLNKDREKNLSYKFLDSSPDKLVSFHDEYLKSNPGLADFDIEQFKNLCKTRGNPYFIYSYGNLYANTNQGEVHGVVFIVFSDTSQKYTILNKGSSLLFSNNNYVIRDYGYIYNSYQSDKYGMFYPNVTYKEVVANVQFTGEFVIPSGANLVESYTGSDVIMLDNVKEFETSQPDLEIQANPDYDSEISVSIPTTEISSEQLTESPYKENSETFSYPDKFEETVNNTTINNEYNKNPIKEGNEGLLDYGDTVNLDFSPLYGAVEDKFPFCIPFDLFHAIDTLTAEKEKPEFTITFPSVAGSKPASFIFNFDDYELVIEIFRYFVLLAFCIGLVVNTKKILGGS